MILTSPSPNSKNSNFGCPYSFLAEHDLIVNVKFIKGFSSIATARIFIKLYKVKFNCSNKLFGLIGFNF